ncbi:pre-mRNA-splicing factor ISY1 homolog [Planococcus citri]|uniref:pre-mRNA-splicing factor ISY1 homolog n=1 Tax=Planococcus citri TaxID=170843 RepID=UPI0031FA38EA
MARNAEKAMTTLARWRAAQVHGKDSHDKERRPYLATECTDLRKCEKWRIQIIREIARKVSQIQNAGLGEFRIRDLNDDINKLIREKGHWEAQIKELGGPDYARVGPRMLDHEGREVPGNRGYKYFGAAKDLPGVRELFEQEPPPPPRKTRGELMREIDADYYGYRDDDDGILIPIEEREEKAAIENAVNRWKQRGDNPNDEQENEEEDLYAVHESDDEENQSNNGASNVAESSKFVAHVSVPSQDEIKQALLLRKKQELLERYAAGDGGVDSLEQ